MKKRKFQTGGYNVPNVPQSYGGQNLGNPNTGTYTLAGFGTQQYQTPVLSNTGYIPYTGATPLGQPVQFTGPQYTTATQTTNFPTFGETVGTKAGQYDEIRTYVNDAGQTRRIPFKNGQPIYPIPAGFRPTGDTSLENQSTVTPTTGSTSVTGGGGDGGGDGGYDPSNVSGSVRGPASTTTSLSGSFLDVFSGKPAEAQPYGITTDSVGTGKGPTLSGLNAFGATSYDSKGNVIGPSVTDFSNNVASIQDALGVYGTGPINLGLAANILMGNIPGALLSASGIGPDTSAFGRDAPAGFGAFSTEQLDAYTSGKMSPMEMQATGISAMDKNQAFARAQVQRNIGTPITGIVGYNRGDISPLTGTPVNQYGVTVNFNGSTTGVESGYSSMGGWIDGMKAAVKSGWYGGFKSKSEVAKMSKETKGKYAAYAEEFGANSKGEGVGTPGKAAAAELGEGKGKDKGFGPTGRQSSTGRQDYSGGIPQDTQDAPSAPSVGVGETGPDTGDSSSGLDDFGDYGGFDGDYGDIFNKGGLASQMKRSGLASKK